MLPPSDVKASDLWLKLNETPRPSEIIDFPRRDPSTGMPVGRVRLQVLQMEQHDQARINAHKWLAETKKMPPKEYDGPTLREVYGDRTAREILAMATLTVEPIPGSEQTGRLHYNRIFHSADDLDILSADELTVLWTAWEMVQHKYGPYEGNLNGVDDENAWIKRLVEGGSAYPLASLSWHQLVELVLTSAQRSYTLSAILASLGSSLPDTLAVPLQSWGIGTSSFGVLPESAEAIGLTHEAIGLDEADVPVTQAELDAYNQVMPNRAITAEEAAEMAKALFKNSAD